MNKVIYKLFENMIPAFWTTDIGLMTEKDTSPSLPPPSQDGVLNENPISQLYFH